MKVIISAGGTGGHIYPALAVINKIKASNKDTQFLYIGTHNRMEKDIVPKYDIPYEEIEIYGFNRRHLFKNFKTIKCLMQANKKCKKLMKDFKPDVVMGFGGYVTVPVIKTASKLGFKTFIHEQNSVPGKANQYLSNYADMIGLSFKSSKQYFPKEKAILTGNPCSEDALKVKPINKKDFNLIDNKKLVLVVMGSLGASKVNEFLIKTMSLFNDKDYEILYVTGQADYEKISKFMFPKNVKIVAYIDQMTRIMQQTDIMITRAGASTLSEIIALEIPSIIIPSPYVTNNHQYKNAIDLINNKAGIMVEEKDLKGDILVREVDKLINDSKTIKNIKNNLKQMQVNNSASIIYDNILNLIDRK
ncbi:MAG: undecaprenyldiphospho-muramoylpentapeptide beta-N-acetylglucosaminyltransferase [Bacilli bacterium]